MDTEEATSIWYTDKTRESLKNTISKIEIVINAIKQRGIQYISKQNHSDFIKIVHDYPDAKKGFSKWKGKELKSLAIKCFACEFSHFTCDISVPFQEFDYFYKHTVCSGYATIVLGVDWQKRDTSVPPRTRGKIRTVPWYSFRPYGNYG